jgi:hypothetical protein
MIGFQRLSTISCPLRDSHIYKIIPGDYIWSQNDKGEKIKAKIIKTSKKLTYNYLKLTFSNNKELILCPDQPTIKMGKRACELKINETYNGLKIKRIDIVSLKKATPAYDILPNSETGFYWINGILMGSGLNPNLLKKDTSLETIQRVFTSLRFV